MPREERAGKHTVTGLPYREADVSRRKYEIFGAGHELEPAVALDQPRDVREPAGVDVDVLVHLVRGTKKYGMISCAERK